VERGYGRIANLEEAAMNKEFEKKKKKKYENPALKKESFNPQMEKCRKFNKVITGTTVAYAACSSCGVA
jgi:hypothetical protein